MIVAFGLLAALASTAPIDPAQAVALADGHKGYPVEGVFRMTVASTGRHAGAVFLNSSTDYRAPGDLTFELTDGPAKALEKRLGAKPETVLTGKVVTVRGAVSTVPIVETQIGGGWHFKRVQHRVRIYKIDQLTIE